VLLGRLLPLARTFVSLPAGARRVPLVPFIALTAIGCALWACAFVLAGLLVGTAWSAVGSVLGRVLLGIGLVVLAASLWRTRRG
jgi:membrane protein DedA with SNARE-associated domain